jgi:phosphatidylinositol kinase/protein kinase (PI-3  family)
VDMTQIVVKSSQSRPVILRFRTQQDRYIRIMFKRESIFNDLTVINLITLSDIILNENLNTQFGIVVYPVMPITYDTGMIEIIDHAETIYDIFAKKHTILQYIIENNEESKVKDIMDHYMYSLVSYTLHSYFLGLGDRHLQNIMVTRNGALFHIDFSFILGNDAHPITGSNIRLNSSMLETLGGSESYRYRLYLEYCAKGITILRKYFNLFFILLCQNLKYTEKQIEQFIMSRFQPRQIDEVVVYELMTVINNSNNAFIDYIKDYLHYHTQERTLQSGLKKIVRTTYNAIKNII